jgi:hypothetical protein
VKHLVVTEKRQEKPSVEIEMRKLVYKITLMSIFIENNGKVLRLDGPMMVDIGKTIEVYKLLNEKFGDS